MTTKTTSNKTAVTTKTTNRTTQAIARRRAARKAAGCSVHMETGGTMKYIINPELSFREITSDTDGKTYRFWEVDGIDATTNLDLEFKIQIRKPWAADADPMNFVALTYYREIPWERDGKKGVNRRCTGFEAMDEDTFWQEVDAADDTPQAGSDL